MLALAVWSSAFTSVAIATGFERRYGVLERLASTPLGRSGLLAGKAGAVLLIMVGQLVILTRSALALGWRPAFTAGLGAGRGRLVILAAAAFVSLALLLAGRLRAEIDPGRGQPGLLCLLAGGALVMPLDRYPAVLQPVICLLPTAALGEGLRAAAPAQALGWPLPSAGLAGRVRGRWRRRVPMDPDRACSGPRALPRWAVASLVANIGIVVTGGLVRLTGSGLGCPTWPRCTETPSSPIRSSASTGPSSSATGC